jgi:hypothetical protein
VGLEQTTVREIVDKAVQHRWGVPEFQRGFVWRPQRVRDLVDSLWRGYPVGSFLLWYGSGVIEPRVAADQKQPDGWIVDGQQRTTALCILLGRKPYWWHSDDWNEKIDDHDVRFDVLAEEEPHFSLRSAAMRGDAGRRWVSVREALAADDDALAGMIQELLSKLKLPGGKFGMLWSRLDAVRRIRDQLIPVVTTTLDLEDVTEIFARLNSAGTKVTEADIALALAASENPGWARKEFLPFIKEMDEAGFDLDPNLIFRSCVAIDLGRSRLKEVPRDYWRSEQLPAAWKRTQQAWRRVVSYVEGQGVLSADVLPTKNALIPLAIIGDKFADAFGDGTALGWLLHATRSGRYSGSALTALDADLKLIAASSSGAGAYSQLRSALLSWQPFSPADFKTDYADRFLRLIVYLVMYERKARDWLSGERIGFQGNELLERFNPDWHHIFPRAYLRKAGLDENSWNVFANIAVVSPSTNIRFGARDPMGYLQKYNINDSMLEEQLVAKGLLTLDHYSEFVDRRAQDLATAANKFVRGLGL